MQLVLQKITQHASRYTTYSLKNQTLVGISPKI